VELVDTILSIINHTFKDDKALDEAVHEMLTFLQVNRIIDGKDKLEDFPEPHRTELRNILARANEKVAQKHRQDEQTSPLATKNVKLS
jgi:hypothetical protein